MPRSIRRITLYCAQTAAGDYKPIARSTKARLMLAARRAVDSARWRLHQRFDFQYWAYADCEFSNVGDIAIREASKQNLQALFPGAVIDEVAWHALTPAIVDQINETSDLFVISAGAFAQIRRDGTFPHWFDTDLAHFRRLRCPIVSYGIGVSHKIHAADGDRFQMSEHTREALAEFVTLHTLCGVRDERSRAILQEFAPTGRPVHYLPDPALSLTAPAPLPLAGSPRIGLNFAFHGPHVESLQRAHFADFSATISELRRRFPGSRFYYFRHSDEERLFVRLLRSLGHDFEVIEGAPDRLMAAYASLDIHLAMMLHSCILAANAGTPALNFAYDTKNSQFYRSLGLSEWCLEPEQFSTARFVERASTLIERASEVRPLLAAARRGQLDIHSKFLARLFNAATETAP